MSKWYKINLLPLGPFFFGQELVAEQGNRQDYFKRSAAFPQQSTLLGMLRHQILLQHGLATPKVNGAAGNVTDLIADRGFEPEITVSKYGKIKQLSPIFLQKNGNGHYFLSDNEWVKKAGVNEVYALTMSPIPNIAIRELRYSSLSGDNKSTHQLHCKSNSKEETEPYTNKFKPKEKLVDIGGSDSIAFETVFGTAEAVGVYKFASREGDQKESDQSQGYFKNVSKLMGERSKIPMKLHQTQQFYEKPIDNKLVLNPAWTFGFYVEIEDDATLALSDNRVAIMGKEQSAFLIQISDGVIDRTWMSPKLGNDLQKVVLLSDAFVDEPELLKDCLLITGSTVRFRSFTKQYHPSDRHANLKSTDKSACHHLLKRGTVIYTHEAGKVASHLEANINWRTIGNNYFMITPAK